MTQFFGAITAIAMLAALVGIILPKQLLFFLQPHHRTRLKAFGFYFVIALACSLVGTALMSPEEKTRQAQVRQEAEAARAVEKAEKERAQKAEAEAKAKAEAQALQASRISARDLWAAYDANEVAADNKYKGKRILVVGTATDIKKDITGSPYVAMAVDQFGLTGVNCIMEDEASAAKISRGAKIQVVGTVNGMSIGNVFLRDCQIN